MPPSKEAKSSVEDVTEEAKAEKMSDKSPDSRKKTGPPPTPPNKPSSSSSVQNLAEASQSRPNPHPPMPPSKEKKPSHPAVDSDQEVQGSADENKEKEEVNRKETAGVAVETDEADDPISTEALPSVSEIQVSEEESGETITSPCPLQPNDGQDHVASLQTASDTSDHSPQTEDPLPKSEVPSVVVSSNNPLSDSLSLSPLLCHLPGEKKKKAEEKSVDSGQHSDDDSEGSGNEDTLAASTAALRGSHARLDVLDASEDNIQISFSLRPAQTAAKPQVRSEALPCPRSKPATPLKPSAKARSASIGDLLSDFSQVKQHTSAVAGSDRFPTDDVTKLETEVALEMEKTGDLLSRVSQSKGGGDSEDMPEDLLAKAMEKLKKADHVLREVKKLKLAKDSNNRKSW